MYSYAVIGTGAIGGYYGARLAESGRTVHFLARSDAEYIRENGLKILSPQGDVLLEDVSVFTSAGDVPRVDVILVSLKTTQNHRLKEIIGPLVSPGTVILLMQNGLGMEEEVSSLFPEGRVLGGMCFICSQKREPGVITHMDYGALTLGCLNDSDRAALEKVSHDFNQSGISVSTADNLGEARWRKLLWNIPYNGLTVALDSHTKDIMDQPSSRAIVRKLMEEVIEGAASCGYKIEQEAIDKMLAFTDKMTPYEPSMKLDFNNKRAMELDYMYRRPLETARKNGCTLHAVSFLLNQLDFIENRYPE